MCIRDSPFSSPPAAARTSRDDRIVEISLFRGFPRFSAPSANSAPAKFTWHIRCICSGQESSTMQMIEAVIKPHKLDAVKTGLAKIGILGVTAVECKGYGRQMGHTERYRGAKMDVGFVPKVLLKICVKSDETTKAVTAITDACLLY